MGGDKKNTFNQIEHARNVLEHSGKTPQLESTEFMVFKKEDFEKLLNSVNHLEEYFHFEEKAHEWKDKLTKVYSIER